MGGRSRSFLVLCSCVLAGVALLPAGVSANFNDVQLLTYNFLGYPTHALVFDENDLTKYTNLNGTKIELFALGGNLLLGLAGKIIIRFFPNISF